METSKASTEPNPRETVNAVIGMSPAVPQDQLAFRSIVAEDIWLPPVQVATTEGSDEIYNANRTEACLACEMLFYSGLLAVPERVFLEDSLLVHSNKYQGADGEDTYIQICYPCQLNN